MDYSNDNMIIAEQKEAYETVGNFAKSIDYFSENVSEILKNIESAVKEMRNGWQGTSYESFAQAMDKELRSVEGCLKDMDDLSGSLQQKATELKELIDFLDSIGAN